MNVFILKPKQGELNEIEPNLVRKMEKRTTKPPRESTIQNAL